MKKSALIKKLCMSIGLMLSLPIQAELLHFGKLEKEDSYEFTYKWKNTNNQIDHLVFNLSKTDLFDQFRNFKAYNPDIATKYVNHKIKKHLIKEPLPDVTIKYSKSKKAHPFIISGRDTEAIEKAKKEIRRLEELYFQAYLNTHYYQRFETHNQVMSIKPDHRKFARESAQALKTLKPLILEKVSIQNIRLVTEFTLNFIQNIPYSTLESRTLTSGLGFNPPLKVLWENQGDCDSKATLAIAILRSLMPRVKLALVFLEEHALIAIHIPPKGDELSIKVNHETYVLADPTGPRKLSLGKVSDESKRLILQGQYVAEVFK